MGPNVTRLLFTSIKLKKLLIVCLLFFLLASTAGATEYIVKPAPSDQAGASIKGEKVRALDDFTIYWEFMLWLSLINVLSVVDVLLYPVKIIFVILGFKITKNENQIDRYSKYEVYDYIKTRPGAYISEIVEKLGLGRGVVKRHVYALRTMNKIEAYEDGGKIRYFETNFTYSEEEKKVISALQSITNQRIISEIQNGKCNTNIALAREFGVSRATVSWYVRNLREIGLIEETKNGRTITYRVNDTYNSLLYGIEEN